MTKTHKISGWTRTALGFGHWRIVPTDDSGVREVAFLSRGTWQNHANDTREASETDRVVLVSGPELPVWAVDWLTAANALSCQRARRAFQAALDDADWAEDRRTADAY